MEPFAENAAQSMLLNMQMIADPLDELFWDFTLSAPEDSPRLRCCQIYCGQKLLQEDTVYLLPEGTGVFFPRDKYAYITPEDLSGGAAHIRNLRRPIYEVLNEVIAVFQRYHDFEVQLSQVVTGGGSLVDLCRIGSDFFQNPVYIHDNMFCVIAMSSKVQGMLEFEYNENTGKLYIPLWLIDEFKFDESYQDTMTRRHAGTWGNEQYPFAIRSLYVNLRSGENYCGRILINELRSSLLPGQYVAAEYLASYAVKIIQRDEADPNHRYRGLADTFLDLLAGVSVDSRELRTTLNILNWHPMDRYLCLRLRNQDSTLTIRSDRVLNNTLASEIKSYFSFLYQNCLCMVVNLTQTGTDLYTIRHILAPYVRDSCMYVGISNPVGGIHAINVGFRQADIALAYITTEDNSQWIVSFSECALSFIRGCAVKEIPADLLVDPALNTLLQFDKGHGTQYYETLCAYLTHERSIPKTAAALIIHRTTLTYRLERIQEIVRLNLDDPHQRLYLLLSLFILDSGLPG